MAYFNLTSGTTGISKCAVTTHANIYWNTKSAVECLALTPDDIHLCMFPVFAHPHELFARPLFLGGTIVLINTIFPKAIAKTISDNKVTCIMAVASIYETLVRLHKSSPFSLDSLRLPESGGMHINPDLAENFRDRFKTPLVPVWGSTETAGIALSASVHGRNRPGSMGKPCPYYDVKVTGSDGTEPAPGESGEMAIRGPAVCTEYYSSPEETGRHMKDGWFHTGDIVKKDPDGNFFFVGRQTGMMKVAGMKVFPTEIEDVLITHPLIAEVAVVRGNHRLYGEIPKAVIVPEEGHELGRKEIRLYCERALSKYKVPRVIEFRKELPKTPGGKILSRLL